VLRGSMDLSGPERTHGLAGKTPVHCA